MENGVKQEFNPNQCCCTCLSKGTTIYSIFENGVHLLFFDLLQIETLQNDHIPLAICENCRFQLQNFAEFKSTALSSFSLFMNGGLTPAVNESNFGQQEDSSRPASPLEVSFDIKIETKAESDDLNSCPNCSKTFKYQQNFRRHVQTCRQALDGLITCNECGEMFEKLDLLKHWQQKHMKKEPKRALHPCDACSEAFKSRKSLTKHLLVVHGQEKKRFNCSYCPKVFDYLSGLTAHENVHTKAQSLICDQCGAVVYSKTALRNHIRNHSAPGYDCPHCHRNCRTKNGLEYHLSTKHVPPEEKKWVCVTCGKKFGGEMALNTHETQVHIKKVKKKKSKCDVCGVIVSNIRNHVRIHTDERPFSCELCDMSFRRRSTLQKHAYSHSKTRPYNCTLCQQGYYSREYLKAHMTRVHSQQQQQPVAVVPAWNPS